MRNQFLAYEQRLQTDVLTFGEIFFACCEETADISFMESLYRIQSLALDKFRTHDLVESELPEFNIKIRGLVEVLPDCQPENQTDTFSRRGDPWVPLSGADARSVARERGAPRRTGGSIMETVSANLPRDQEF